MLLLSFVSILFQCKNFLESINVVPYFLDLSKTVTFSLNIECYTKPTYMMNTIFIKKLKQDLLLLKKIYKYNFN